MVENDFSPQLNVEVAHAHLSAPLGRVYTSYCEMIRTCKKPHATLV